MIYWILLAMAAIGAVSVPIYKFAILSLSPILTVFIRAILSFLLILPFVYKQLDFKNMASDRKLILSNVLFAANWVFFAIGIAMSSVFMGIILFVPTAVLVALVNYLLFKEKLTRYQVMGLVLVILGMITVVFQTTAINLGNPLGILFIALGALSWVFYLVLSSKCAKSYTAQAITAYNFFTTILVSMLLLPLELRNLEFSNLKITSSGISSLLLTVIFSSVLFFYLYQLMIKKTSAFVSSMAIYPPNIAGIAVSLLILKEGFNLQLIFGTTTVFLGIFMATSFAHARSYIKR